MRLVALLLLLTPWLLSAQPQRIVSTTPSITDMLFALGLGDRVVGVTTFCRYPDAAKAVAKVGDYIHPNLEVIVSLRPDIVFIQENPVNLAAKLRTLRLNVIELRHRSVRDIYDSLGIIGDATGAPEQAQRVAAEIRSELSQIRQRTEALPKRRMMFLIGRAPNAIEAMFAVGQASYLNELIAIAGGTNVFADAGAPYPKVSLEEVLAKDPEVIIDMGDMANTVNVSDEHKRGVVRLWQRYSSLSAVRRGAVFAVASDIFVVPGTRMVDAAREFARMLHPEAGL